MPLRILAGVSSPALTVGIKPAVLLPIDVCNGLSDEQLSYAIMHELTHYKRADHITAALIKLLEIVYWFNPVVYLMRRAITADMETACDSRVTQALSGDARREYALTLLKLFAQPKQRGYVLGMALSGMEKDAERRIRGIYKARKSKPGIKLIAALCAIVMIVCCFTTACQPTPETTIVQQKQENYAQRQGFKTSNDIEKEIGFTEHINDGGELTDKISYTMDADIVIPAPMNTCKVYQAQLADFTQEEANKFAELFVSGVELTSYTSDVQTKDEILETLLLPAKKTLEELKAGTYVRPDYVDTPVPTIEEQEEIVETYQSWYDAAPETNGAQRVDISSYSANNNYFYGEFPIEGSSICGKFAVGFGDQNHQGGMYYYHSSFDLFEQHNIHPSDTGDTSALNMETTKEEAVKLATDLKDRLGAADLTCDFSTSAACWGGDGMSNDSLNAYWVVFTRRIESIPVFTPPISAQYSRHSNELPVERLVITVSDEGIVAVNWVGYTKLGEAMENPQFAQFFDVTAAVEKGIKFQNAHGDPMMKNLHNVYASTRQFMVAVTQPAQMQHDDISTSVPETIVAGETFSLPANVYNTGKSTLKNVMVTVTGAGLFPTSSVFHGDIAPGGTGNGELSIFAGQLSMTAGYTEDYGETSGMYTISYTDDTGEEHKVEIGFTTEITESVIEGDIVAVVVVAKVTRSAKMK